jgi:hypothetical protein
VYYYDTIYLVAETLDEASVGLTLPTLLALQTTTSAAIARKSLLFIYWLFRLKLITTCISYHRFEALLV